MDATPPAVPQAAWRLDWLTPTRCRWLAAGFIVLSFIAHAVFLGIDCPLDLSGDEAHYWDWSRQLDLGYYSKGPLVAWIIRASCAVLGETAFAVRLPALLLASGVSVVTYWIALRLFRSDRLALGTTLLFAAAPMFVAGSMLMTIDPPMMLGYAVATTLVAVASLDDRRWALPLAGVSIGIAALAKYGALSWYVGLVAWLIVDRDARRWLRESRFWLMPPLTLLALLPPILWNARHGWVSFRHVATQTGVTPEGARAWLNPLSTLEMLGTQLGTVGPVLFGFVVLGVVHAWRRARGDDRTARSLRLLLAFGLSFFAVNLVASLRTKIQPNWPAPAYFGLLIVAAWFIATRLSSVETWRPYRGWFWIGIVGVAIVVAPLAHHTQRLYPVARWMNETVGTNLQPRRFDPAARLVGHRELGDRLGAELTESSPGTFILAEDYQAASLAAFYTPGQPRTFYAGSWFEEVRFRRRLSQFDMWDDRRLDRPELLGRDALYVGYVNDDLRRAFERVEPLPAVVVVRSGLVVRETNLSRCIGFRGMARPGGLVRH